MPDQSKILTYEDGTLVLDEDYVELFIPSNHMRSAVTGYVDIKARRIRTDSGDSYPLREGDVLRRKLRTSKNSRMTRLSILL